MLLKRDMVYKDADKQQMKIERNWRKKLKRSYQKL